MSPLIKSALVLALLLPGCGASHRLIRAAPPASLGDAASVKPWEALARPELLQLMAELASMAPGETGACPQVTREGRTTVVRGDCLDEGGKRHTGWARMTNRGDHVHAELHGYGDEDLRMTGVARVWNEGLPRYDVKLEIHTKEPIEDLAPGAHWLALEAHSARDAEGRWSGRGRLAAEGRGTVRVRTQGLWFDQPRCSSEPMGGLMELRSGRDTVEIRYDGATDCDHEGTAHWWRNGVDQGELVGIPGDSGCSIAPRGTAGGGGLLLLVPWLVGARRRRNRGRVPA